MWNTEPALSNDSELAKVIGAIHCLDAECRNPALGVERGTTVAEGEMPRGKWRWRLLPDFIDEVTVEQAKLSVAKVLRACRGAAL